MAKKKVELLEEINENISISPLEEVMSDRYATYAKYVIQDRAIPDVRDGLKPVQRRIIFSMYKSGNTFNKPTKKCAHTVGAVMGTFHPHGDTSIYEALARMSQDWKVRYPLIDFQGNNGSIDGDQPAAYRYTESRLSELSNEMVKDIEKETVDMQLNFDDTEFEPVVLPSRFPNLLMNGTEGIAVGLATEIPPHNLGEIVDAIIYRINHKTADIEDLLQFVKGPDFPGGGIIYRSEGLKNIYLTGRGRIEIAAKTEIVRNKENTQIVISEIPYKLVKSALVYEIDKIIHSKAVSGLLEIRDESDWKGIRIVIDCKKDAKVELLLKHLMSKTSLHTSYTANMVAIVNGRPKTLNLLDFVDAYITHQVDVITRRSKYDLVKFTNRLHIVEALITASININEVVEIIRKSLDKADSKTNLMKRFDFTNEQAEAIVMMPLYKLSHTDEEIFENEKKQLIADIDTLKGILEDSNKLNRVIIKDLKAIVDKYGDERRSQILDKEEEIIVDKRELIAKEEIMLSVSRDGYVKRSSIKSFKGSKDGLLPGLKDGDVIIGADSAFTTDYLVCFTNHGNYACLPVNILTENRWKDEGVHLNSLVTLAVGEKIIKSLAISVFRDDIYLAILTKFGQIKRMSLANIEASKRSKPARYMNLIKGDEVVSIQLLTGNSDVLVLTTNGMATYFNENELTILGNKAGGVKSISNLGKNNAIALLTFDEEEKSKFMIFTNEGHMRVLDNTKFMRTARLGKPQLAVPSFKGEPHTVLTAVKVDKSLDSILLDLYISNGDVKEMSFDDFHLFDIAKYAKKNIDIPAKSRLEFVTDAKIERINTRSVSRPVQIKEKKIDVSNFYNEIAPNEDVKEEDENPVSLIEENENNEPEIVNEEPKAIEKEEKKTKEDAKGFEQISIFDDLDE